MSEPTPAFSTGQHVRITEAESGAPDPKALVYYSYFRNLTGSVVKAYPDGTVAISIDRSSLPDEIRKRHESNETAQRDRWLNGLADEDRNKLSAKEKQFSLRYTVLVSSKHVVPESTPAQAADQPKAKAEPAASVSAPERKTTADLDAAEQAYLEQKKQG